MGSEALMPSGHARTVGLSAMGALREIYRGLAAAEEAPAGPLDCQRPSTAPAGHQTRLLTHGQGGEHGEPGEVGQGGPDSALALSRVDGPRVTDRSLSPDDLRAGLQALLAQPEYSSARTRMREGETLYNPRRRNYIDHEDFSFRDSVEYLAASTPLEKAQARKKLQKDAFEQALRGPTAGGGGSRPGSRGFRSPSPDLLFETPNYIVDPRKAKPVKGWYSSGPEDREHMTVLGTPNYMSAEMREGNYSVAADVFALGLVALECMTLKRASEVLASRDIPSHYSKRLRALVQKMTGSEAFRPSASQVCTLAHQQITRSRRHFNDAIQPGLNELYQQRGCIVPPNGAQGLELRDPGPPPAADVNRALRVESMPPYLHDHFLGPNPVQIKDDVPVGGRARDAPLVDAALTNEPVYDPTAGYRVEAFLESLRKPGIYSEADEIRASQRQRAAYPSRLAEGEQDRRAAEAAERASAAGATGQPLPAAVAKALGAEYQTPARALAAANLQRELKTGNALSAFGISAQRARLEATRKYRRELESPLDTSAAAIPNTRSGKKVEDEREERKRVFPLTTQARNSLSISPGARRQMGVGQSVSESRAPVFRNLFG